MPGLQLENLSKSFIAPNRQKIRALQDLTLELYDNEPLVLLGPSGCGKTTTLRLIAGLEKADSGRIFLLGKEITPLRPADRNISFVFQNPALLPQLDVRANILLGLKLRKIPVAEREARLKEIVQLLNISEILDRYPEKLSGGQQQRVSLARALITKPDLLLLDEPLSNLDPLTRHQLRHVIRRLQHQLKKPMIYVTHDQAEAFYLGARIGLLNEGRLEQISSPRELISDPSTLFVARFVGNGINILKDGGEPRILKAIRAESINIHPAAKHEGAVSDAIDLATHWEIHIKTEQTDTIRAISPHQLKKDSPVRFDIPENKIFRFEKETGARIR